jgi:hypothetical protein
VAHLTVSMAPNFTTFTCGSQKYGMTAWGAIWPPLRTTGVDDNDCGDNNGMRIGSGNRSHRRKPATCRLIMQKSYMIEPGSQRWEAGNEPLGSGMISTEAEHEPAKSSHVRKSLS